jgi:hypothetical protein
VLTSEDTDLSLSLLLVSPFPFTLGIDRPTMIPFVTEVTSYLEAMHMDQDHLDSAL